MLKKKVKLLIFILLISGIMSLETKSQTSKSVELIKNIYRENTEKQVDCETNGETSSTFLSEIILNKNNGSYPAVGIYQKVVKFYYTFGNRQKNPYPSRLLKIVVNVKRSSQTEFFEFLFDSQENLIFYFEKTAESEKRLYFLNGKPIHFLLNEKIVKLKNSPTIKTAQTILQEARKLKNIFSQTLE